MSNKPIFVATHPRACSTAFERVRNQWCIYRDDDTLTYVGLHDPPGDYAMRPRAFRRRLLLWPGEAR